MQNPGELHAGPEGDLLHRVGRHIGEFVGKLVGGSPEQPATEEYDPGHDYLMRQEALRALWLDSLPEDVAASRDTWYLEELANVVGPEAMLAAFEPENEVLWTHDSGRLIQNCVVGSASRMFANIVEEGRNPSDKESQMWFLLLAQLGLDPVGRSEVTRAWDTLSYDELVKEYEDANMGPDKTPHELATASIAEIIRRNFITMFGLEMRQQGAVRALYDKFGIRNFGRYEPDDLLPQLTLERRAELPLSVVVSDADDFNRALAMNENRGTAKKLLAGTQIIFAEARRGNEALRRVVSIAHQLGPIDELMIASHVSEHAIGNTTSGVLTLEDVERAQGLARLRAEHVLSEKAVAMLYGCLAGAPDGIATALARTAGVPMFAFDSLFPGFDDFLTSGESGQAMRIWDHLLHVPD